MDSKAREMSRLFKYMDLARQGDDASPAGLGSLPGAAYAAEATARRPGARIGPLRRDPVAPP